MMKRKLVVLSGAGISAESGVKTFRDNDGLWEGYDVMDVASPEGFRANPIRVFEFYNQRRKQARSVKPNKGHLALTALEKAYDVTIITQNVDELHEKAGSSHVMHLHGKLSESRSTGTNKVYPIMGTQLNLGDLCPDGHQLRPNIVWFGEEVPVMEQAAEITALADVFIVVGTSLVVYPAAGLIDLVPTDSEKYIVDPMVPSSIDSRQINIYEEKASTGVPKLVESLLSKSKSIN